jgi:hypothetical protein
MVSIPFHQIMRSTCPVFTVLIYRVRYDRTYARETYLSLVPVVLGVGLATYGDYYFTVAGFVLTLVGVLLAAVKVRPGSDHVNMDGGTGIREGCAKQG